MSTSRFVSLAVVVVVSLAVVPDAEARSNRVNQVPNNEWNCSLCHQNPAGSGPRTDLGKQVEQHLSDPVRDADVDWQAIYDLDADGDGFTNGEELGDPNGDWEIGDDDPQGEVTNPNDPNDKPAGGGGDAGMTDAGSMVDTGSGGGGGSGDSGCSAVGGTPVGGVWWVLFVGAFAWWRRD